jgi:hypothetical protein
MRSVKKKALYPCISFIGSEIQSYVFCPVVVCVSIKEDNYLKRVIYLDEDKKKIINVSPNERIEYGVYVRCVIIEETNEIDISHSNTILIKIDEIVENMETYTEGLYIEDIMLMKRELALFHECMRNLFENVNEGISIEDIISIPSFVFIILKIKKISCMITYKINHT